MATENSLEADTEIMRFAGDRTVPIWLAYTYLGSNIVLNSLNFYWFGKMIETVKKRFRQPKEKANGTNGKIISQECVATKMNENGHMSFTAEKTEVRRRKA